MMVKRIKFFQRKRATYMEWEWLPMRRAAALYYLVKGQISRLSLGLDGVRAVLRVQRYRYIVKDTGRGETSTARRRNPRSGLGVP